jgi:hypothetical protein
LVSPDTALVFAHTDSGVFHAALGKVLRGEYGPRGLLSERVQSGVVVTPVGAEEERPAIGTPQFHELGGTEPTPRDTEAHANTADVEVDVPRADKRLTALDVEHSFSRGAMHTSEVGVDDAEVARTGQRHV